MLRRKSLFGCVLTLVLFALVFSGCGSSSGGGGGSNSNDAGGDVSGYIGVWKNTDYGVVEVTVGNQIASGEGYRCFAGKVTCSAFRDGSLDISGTNPLEDNYIVVNIFDFGGRTMTSFHVRAREEYDDGFDTVVNEFELDGALGDAKTLKVHRLRISSQKNNTEHSFDPEDDSHLTFTK